MWKDFNDWLNLKVIYPLFSRIYWNFGIIDKDRDGKPELLRSRLPNGLFIKYLAEKYKLKSILSLEDDYDEDMDKWCEHYGIHHITVLNHCSAKNIFQNKEDLKLYLSLVHNTELHPMLIRCRGGADRTGAAVAIWRMEEHGWRNWLAWIEMLTYFHFFWKYKDTTKLVLEYKTSVELKAEEDLIKRGGSPDSV